MNRQLNSFPSRVIAIIMVVMMLLSTGVSAENVLSLYRNKAEDGVPFSVVNMFPGDCETKVYDISISYNGYIDVYFTADVREGYEKLAEVMKCRVVLKNSGELLYDGLMKDMPDLVQSIAAVNATEIYSYEISAYLDTSVGNDYKNKELVADFNWWAYTSDEGYPGDDGGGSGGIIAPIRPSTPPDGGDPVIPPGGEDPVTPPDDGSDPSTHPDDGSDPSTHPGDGSDPSTRPGDGSDPSDSQQGGMQPDDGQRPTGQLIKPPKTGDIENPVLWIVLICISLFVIIFLIFLFFGKKKDKKQENDQLLKKLTICIIVIVILAVCLCITTFALIYSIVSVNENIFKTGTVEINLNDGKPIITENEFLFEPGMTVVKDFFIENESSDAVYYKIYFDKVAGGLAKVLDVKILDKKTGEKLYSGKAKDLIRENCDSAELAYNETRTLTAEFHYPPLSGNETQNLSMSFDLCAVATQKRNNTNREFE